MRAPKGWQDEGMRLWRSVTAVFDLADEPHKFQILAQACRVADVISELERRQTKRR
jgi:hypothetical protein